MKNKLIHYYERYRKQGVYFLFKLVKPQSKNEVLKRKEFILNIFLVSLMIMIFFAIALLFDDIFKCIVGTEKFENIPILYLAIIFIFIYSLYQLAKKGYAIIASKILIFFYLFITLYFIYCWGVEIPTGLLSLSLVIIMSGILISNVFSNYIMIFITLAVLSIAYAEVNGIYSPDLSWRLKPIRIDDAIMYLVILGIINVFAWLSNHEIEKSLKRARTSEIILKKERDLLEIKVEKRTEELKRAQIEKMSQMAHMAEFGKLASGIFHDLVNPLTAISLNLELLKTSKAKEIIRAKKYLEQALHSTHRMDKFVTALKKQIQQQEIRKKFSPNEEIRQVIEILSYKARKNDVIINLFNTKGLTIFGNSLKFHQVITNILSNAIDSFEPKSDADKKNIIIRSYKDLPSIIIEIKDNGCGISKKNIQKIFDPFFTTKDIDKGTGIGLSFTREIIRDDFLGDIQVFSKVNVGTTFKIIIPTEYESENS